MKPLMKLVLGAVLGLGVGNAISIQAAEDDVALPEAEANQPPAPPVRDYGAGFEAFFNLGLPRLDNTTRYVKLQAYGPNIQTHRPIQHIWDLQLAGTAWLVEELPDGVHRFVLLNGRSVDVMDAQVLQARRLEAMQEQPRQAALRQQPDDVIGGTWQDADAAADLKTILDYLNNRAAGQQGMRNISMDGYGALFVAMATFYDAGHTDDSNRIISSLFNMGQDPRHIIAAGIDQLGNTRYEAVLQEFQRTRDWSAFDDSLNDLTDRFSAGWRMAPLVGLLTERIAARLQDERPRIAGYTPEQQVMADALLEAGRLQGRPGRSSRIWILADDPSPAVAADEDEIHPIDWIFTQRMDAVPFLIALLEDDALTSLMQQDLGAYGIAAVQHGWSPRPNERLTEERIREGYRRMNRPLERRDIARRMLEPLLIAPAGDSARRHGRMQMDDQDLAVEITDWYDKYKNETRSVLARIYLTDGDSAQVNSVLPLLTASEDTDDHAAVENYFISTLQADASNMHRGMGQMHQVQNYVFKHGAAAKDFAERYIAAWEALHAEPPPDDEDAGRAAFQQPEQMRQQMEAQIKQLRILVSAESPGDLLAKVSSGDLEISEVMPVLQRFLYQQTMTETLDLLLPFLQHTDDDAMANVLFATFENRARVRTMQRMHGGHIQASVAEIPDPMQHAGLWRALLEDKMARPGSVLRASRTAQLMESVYGDLAWQQQQRPVLWGARLETLMMERALARLDGTAAEDLPDYPDPASVDDGARTAIREQLTGADDPDRLRAILADLSPAAELALSEMLAEDTALNSRLQSVSITVSTVDAAGEDDAVAARLATFDGRQWDRELVNELHQWGRELAEAGQAIQLTVDKKTGVAGLTLSAEPLSDLKQRTHPLAGQGESDDLPPAIRAEFRTADMFVQADWPVEGSDAPATPAADAGDEEIDLLDMMERELETVLDTRQTERRTMYWQAVDSHPQSTWRADQSFQATIETHPRTGAPRARP